MEPIDDEALIAEFTTYLRSRDLNVGTERQYPQHVQYLNDFIGGNLIGVDEDALSRYIVYLRSRNILTSTIKRYFVGLASFYTFLVYKKHIPSSPITPIFKQLYLKQKTPPSQRQNISIDEAKALVASILDPREKAIVVLLLKTGMRRHELSELDVGDVDIPNKTVTLKPTRKRSNPTLQIDDECAYVLNRWLKQREHMNPRNLPALFVGKTGERLTPRGIYRIVQNHAVAAGLHNTESDDPEDHFSPHCCRYFFTTQLLDHKMEPKLVQYLRGDSIRESIDIYYRPDQKLLKREYEQCMPSLGII